MLTLGEYLRPSLEQMPVVRYLTPEEFQELGEAARHSGFRQVASGPFVCSSYHARGMIERMKDEKEETLERRMHVLDPF